MAEEGHIEPLARRAYEELAESYAKLAPTKPHNAYYERPATLSLLGEVREGRVLDAGCGPGVYAEILVACGAEVVGFDASEKMVVEGGFDLTGLLEPRPDERFRRADPEDYEKLSRMPGFLCLEVRKPGSR